MNVSAEALREVALTRAEYDQIVELLGREPTQVELGMFGAMWSEHCGYKYSRPLLKLLPDRRPRVLQGPGENAGAVDIGDGLAVVFKIESHNHPSAVEPYQGAATGVGGIVRDIFTMGARPIALLDSLRFGPLDQPRNRYLFDGVVGGIGGYGNCLGIPTVGGEVFFDPSYNGNPLVNAMCVGIVRHDDDHARDSVRRRQPGDAGRRGHRPRRHPRRHLRCQSKIPRSRTAACSGRQPVPGEAAAGSLPGGCWSATTRRRDAGSRRGWPDQLSRRVRQQRRRWASRSTCNRSAPRERHDAPTKSCSARARSACWSSLSRDRLAERASDLRALGAAL